MPPDSAHNAEPPMKDPRARVAEPPDSAHYAPEPGLRGRFTTRPQSFRGLECKAPERDFRPSGLRREAS
eukprot:2304765-Alexandrium_andersonii.AAC.1